MRLKKEQIPQHLLKYFKPVHKQFILRNDCIWAKRNGMPESVTDRFTVKKEYFFLMVKQRDYYFDLDAIKDKLKEVSIERYKRGVNVNKYTNGPDGQTPQGICQPRPNVSKYHQSTIDKDFNNRGWDPEKGKNPGDVSDFWDIPTKPSSEKHYATYNDNLLKKPVLAGCPPGGIIYDPFIGAGSTAEVALRADRKFIGSEMNMKYCEIARKRIAPYLNQLKLF